MLLFNRARAYIHPCLLTHPITQPSPSQLELSKRKPLTEKEQRATQRVVGMLTQRRESKRVFFPNEMEELRCVRLLGGFRVYSHVFLSACPGHEHTHIYVSRCVSLSVTNTATRTQGSATGPGGLAEGRRRPLAQGPAGISV